MTPVRGEFLTMDDSLTPEQLEELRREIKTSIKQIDDGQVIPLDLVRKRIQSRRAKQL
jgi:BMFP domain-containing protein YqiC